MLNDKMERELCYLVRVDAIEPIVGSDNCEAAVIGGWRVMVHKDEFFKGDIGIYFEIDSKVPETEEFAFLEKRKYKVKTQRFTFGGRGNFVSQGLLMHPLDFGFTKGGDDAIINPKTGITYSLNDNSRFLTKVLNVTYAEAEDNARKANSADKYKLMSQRRPNLFKQPWARWMMRRNWGRKVMFFFFGKKKDKNKGFPTHFPYIKKTDQERAENMMWVLEDKTPFIVTQKCDGSSGTYILERKKKNKFEFYVCSRNIRQLNEKQECFYPENNYYWEVANKYDIENKMKDWMKKHPDVPYLCWQGEICAPQIQGNPHKLTETHFFAFHSTDGIQGRWDIREAKKVWDEYGIPSVPIVDENYILPDDFEQFKLSAEGFYDASVCEGKTNCPREGYVYYKTTDPNFSFKNVSRKYLLSHGQ